MHVICKSPPTSLRRSLVTFVHTEPTTPFPVNPCNKAPSAVLSLWVVLGRCSTVINQTTFPTSSSRGTHGFAGVSIYNPPPPDKSIKAHSEQLCTE